MHNRASAVYSETLRYAFLRETPQAAQRNADVPWRLRARCAQAPHRTRCADTRGFDRRTATQAASAYGAQRRQSCTTRPRRSAGTALAFDRFDNANTNAPETTRD